MALSTIAGSMKKTQSTCASDRLLICFLNRLHGNRNARDLITEYWNTHDPKKTPRKSHEPSAISKASQSSVNKERSPLVASVGGTKRARGRPRKNPTAISTSISDTEGADEEEEDDAKARQKKKAKRGAAQNGKLKQQRSFADLDKETDADVAMESDTQVEEQEVTFSSMKEFMDQEDWEPLVKSVDTVERQGDGILLVYFTL